MLLWVFSVPKERAAVTAGDDLRGLGTCHQQAFSQVCRVRQICENKQTCTSLHCLPVLPRIRDKNGYTESQIIPNTSKKVSNSGIS